MLNTACYDVQQEQRNSYFKFPRRSEIMSYTLSSVLNINNKKIYVYFFPHTKQSVNPPGINDKPLPLPVLLTSLLTRTGFGTLGKTDKPMCSL